LSPINIIPDIVCDTNILADLLIQYFRNINSFPLFKESEKINKRLCIRLNKIVESEDRKAYIIASTFAFVELARKFNSIFNNSITLYQFRAFIDQPPDWFLIQNLDHNYFPEMLSIPENVILNDELKVIEWADALHVATALRREHFIFATTDLRLKNLPLIKDNII
jgi:predicted nucleic acid-binding protein